MKYHLEDKDISLLDRIGEKTGTDYLWDTKDGYIEIEYIWDALSDLEDKYVELDEKNEELERKLREDYEPKKYDPYMEFGVSESDFH